MPNPYLTFSSPNSFTLNVYDNTKHWDGTLEYSTDTTTWTVWNGTTLLSSGSNNELYLRGTGNTYITGSSQQTCRWVLTGSDISCIGNIENLLDYQTVLNGQHPQMRKNYCYGYLFHECASLITAPALPATTLADYCYISMFSKCTSLTIAPELPATTLANGCYHTMFIRCTSLIAAPELPATTLAYACYQNMFQNCTSLTTAPELPATTLADSCYYSMFSNCTSLTTAPELPAIVLAESCYNNMFGNCTSLTTPPELPATTLARYCYRGMFNGCTSIKLSSTQTGKYQTPYRIPSSGNGKVATDALTNMFTSTGGTFTGTPSINITYYLYVLKYVKRINPNYITFSSPDSFTLNVYDNTKHWNGTLEYSTDTINWDVWNGTITLSSSLFGDNQKLYLRGTGNNIITGIAGIAPSQSINRRWVLTGSDISCTGNIETLLDYQTTIEGNHPTMNYGCYAWLFKNCASLTKAPELPAITLADSCYFSMFSECTSLATAPELPATTTRYQCYASMFYSCTSLISAPALPATDVANGSCYYGMFQSCTSLTSAPDLPATKLSSGCYQSMFKGCTSLVSAQSILPATTLANSCYYEMFYGCTSLTSVPTLPATILADRCYSQMFHGCNSLVTAPTLPATTLAHECYNGMFSNCISLTAAPALPATSLADYCYMSMFQYCTSLTTIPALPATSLANYCYGAMFSSCTSIKLSATQTGDYQTSYRIPSSGTGTAGTNALINMFSSTGGTFTGTPTINTPYYTSNTIIPAN